MASFVIRNIDDEIWKQFKAKAGGTSTAVRKLLLQLIEQAAKS